MSSFQGRNTKLDGLLAKNQHTSHQKILAITKNIYRGSPTSTVSTSTNSTSTNSSAIGTKFVLVEFVISKLVEFSLHMYYSTSANFPYYVGPKIYLILYPSLENKTTHITINLLVFERKRYRGAVKYILPDFGWFCHSFLTLWAFAKCFWSLIWQVAKTDECS